MTTTRGIKAKRGTLTMDRVGEFKVRTLGNSHCGIADNVLIKYAIRVDCTTSLDARGFLFDQINVDRFFQSIGSTDLSCEQFAIDCSRKLWRTILRENPGCVVKRLEVMLSPHPHAASMTFSYDSDRDK